MWQSTSMNNYPSFDMESSDSRSVFSEPSSMMQDRNERPVGLTGPYDLEEVYNILIERVHQLGNEVESFSSSTVLGDSTLSTTLGSDGRQPFVPVNMKALMLKKKQIVTSLTNIVKEMKPTDFPRRRAHAYINLLNGLQQQERTMHALYADTQAKIAETKTDIARMEERCAKLAKMKESSTRNEDSFDQELDETFRACKKDLHRLIDLMFPGDDRPKELLAALVQAAESEDAEGKWITFSSTMDPVANFMIMIELAVPHRIDPNKLQLNSF